MKGKGWIVLACLVFPAIALRAGVESVGTTSMSFLKLGAGARATALGEAFVGLADDASCLQYNPSGMSRLLHGEIQATHAEWFQGFRYENLGLILPLNEGGMLGASLNALIAPTLIRAEQIAETEDPDKNYRLLDEFTPLDLQGAFSYSRPVLPGLLGGGSLKLLSESLADKTALGLVADLGVYYQTAWEGLSLGACVQNLGLPAHMGSQAFYAPVLLRGGGAWRFFRGQGKALLEVDLPLDDAPVLASGLEWDFDGLFQPRVGYRYNQEFNPWSAGLGVKLGTWGLDFSVEPFGELGLTWRGSFFYRFGGPAARLTCSNPVIFSNGPGGEAVISPVVTAPDKVASWGLYIYAPAAQGEKPVLARSLAGKGPLPARLAWDGQLENGAPAPDGSYRAFLALKYQGVLR